MKNPASRSGARVGSQREGDVLPFPRPRSTQGSGAAIGRLVAIDPTSAGPVVDFDGNPDGPVAARVMAPVDAALLRQALEGGLPVVLLFTAAGDPPLLAGILQTAPAPTPAAPVVRGVREARVDGRRVTIDGADEVVLRCGKASITLRRNGRVVVRGTFIETRSQGVNRIRGGSVQLN